MARLTPAIAIFCSIGKKRLVLKRILSYETPPKGLLFLRREGFSAKKGGNSQKIYCAGRLSSLRGGNKYGMMGKMK